MTKEKEIQKLLKQKSRPKSPSYGVYMVLIICLIYITDELASNICNQMKTEVANNLLSRFGDTSVGKLELLSLVSYPCIAISLFYRTLSDRLGRKPFLVINTLGMGLGMFIIFASNNIPGYIIGYCIISFFVPHDMQVVYIMESAPDKHRAKIYSTVKCVATLGVMLIPLLRKTLMTSGSEWHRIFLVPAIIGLVSSFCALLFASETDAFIDSRLHYLSLTEEELRSEKDKEKAAQGGFFAAFKYSMKHAQLRNLNLLMGFFNLGFIITMHYQVMMSYGYAESLVSSGSAATIDDALKVVETNQITSALFLFPVGSALIQLISGFFSDKWGRKPASAVMAFTTVISLAGFVFGARFGISPYITGLLSGACVGSFWAYGDINVMMMSESAPTNLRASVLSSCYVISVIGTFVGMGILLPLMNIFGNGIVAPAALGIAIPGMIVSLVFLSKTKETSGTDLKTVPIDSLPTKGI